MKLFLDKKNERYNKTLIKKIKDITKHLSTGFSGKMGFCLWPIAFGLLITGSLQTVSRVLVPDKTHIDL